MHFSPWKKSAEVSELAEHVADWLKAKAGMQKSKKEENQDALSEALKSKINKDVEKQEIPLQTFRFGLVLQLFKHRKK